MRVESVKSLFRRRMTWLVIGGLLILIALFYYGSSKGISIGDFLSRTMVSATPLILGTLGEIYAERSGVLNLGIEGMMATGAALGAVATFVTGSPWAGLGLAMLGGGILALAFGIITITLRGMQVPAGLGLFLFGSGLMGIIGQGYFGLKIPNTFQSVPIPGLSGIPIIGDFLFSHNVLVYLALLLVPILWFVLFKTRFGLQIRSVGEDPAAADSGGVNVTRVRYICVFIGGILAGLAGAFLPLAWTNSLTEGMVAGRGWIVIALTIFALWSPSRAILGAWLFGGIFALKYTLQGTGVPVRILGMLPYLITLVALTLVLLFSEELGAPSALLEPYERE